MFDDHSEAAKLFSLSSLSTLETSVGVDADDKNQVDFVLVWDDKSQVRPKLLCSLRSILLATKSNQCLRKLFLVVPALSCRSCFGFLLKQPMCRLSPFVLRVLS